MPYSCSLSAIQLTSSASHLKKNEKRETKFMQTNKKC